jgi:uncharacterized protein YndB with AHSA1/START domain
MSTTPNPIVRVSRRYRFSPERVFDAFLDTRMVGTWMFGPALRDEEIVRLELDPRVGGSFSFLVRRQGEEIDHVGTYLEIDRPRRLVFTWAIKAPVTDDSRVTVDIEPTSDGCEVTLTHELHPAWADYAKRTEEGWTTMLRALDSALAAQA